MIRISTKSATRLVLGAMILVLAFGTLSFAQGYRYQSPDAWKFGVQGDTQWTAWSDPEGVNPQFVSAGIVQKLNDNFISHGVRFVVQLGDLSNWAGDAAMYARAEAAQPLFDAGIGFFPIRGNHETYGYYFDDVNHTMNIPAFLDAFPQTRGLEKTFGASNFTHPPNIPVLEGLSYSFDYGHSGNNARFVFVDTEPTKYNVTPIVPTIYGQGYDYPSARPTFVLYKYNEPLAGKTVDANGNYTVDITIEPGTWFRISSQGYLTTNLSGYELIWPIDNNVVPEQPKWKSTNTEYFPGKQQAWISSLLDVTKEGRPTQAFVLTHRGPMNQNHKDSMFGTSSGSKSTDQNVFFASMQNNGVRYLLGAHDHLHNRALLKSPDGKSQIETLISTGASTKFYEPADPSAFKDHYGDNKQRETQISQELFNIGYYIYTVDGPRVLVDYYSDATGEFQDDDNFPYGEASIPAPLYTPNFYFVKKESWGYSLNGKQFEIPQGASYTAVQDAFGATTVKILSGTNSSNAVDGAPTEPRPFIKTVNTGWTAKPDSKLASDIFSLWGMAEFGTDETDVYVLEMSYLDKRVKGKHLGNAGYRLSGLDKNGQWVNAVNLNIGAKNPKGQKFVQGPWKPGYKLGTYGIDMAKGTVWAVINYNADFAVVGGSAAASPK